MHVASLLSDFKAASQVQNTEILILDADVEEAKTRELLVVDTPAIFFYVNGEPMHVQRPGWDDDNKCNYEDIVIC